MTYLISMRSNLILIFLWGICSKSIAQELLTPDAKNFEKGYFKNQSVFHKLSRIDKDGKVTWTATLNLVTRIDSVNKRLVHLQIRNDGKKDSSICELGSLRPIYISSVSKTQKLIYDYSRGSDVAIMENKGKGDVKSDFKMPNPYFDGFLSEYMLGALPLKKGYHAQFETYNGEKNTLTKIKDVYDDVITTGNSLIQPAYVLEMEVGKFTYLVWVDKRTKEVMKTVFTMPDGGLFLKQRI